MSFLAMSIKSGHTAVSSPTPQPSLQKPELLKAGEPSASCPSQSHSMGPWLRQAVRVWVSQTPCPALTSLCPEFGEGNRKLFPTAQGKGRMPGCWPWEGQTEWWWGSWATAREHRPVRERPRLLRYPNTSQGEWTNRAKANLSHRGRLPSTPWAWSKRAVRRACGPWK